MFLKCDNREAREIFKPIQYIVPLFLLMTILLIWNKPTTVLATSTTGTMVNVFVDYADETARVTAGPGGSNKFYISIDKQKTWQDVYWDGVVDISTLFSTKAVDIYFKGNRDTAVKTVTLMAEPNNVKAAYVIKDGIGTISYSVSGAAIEYRKGTNGHWRTPPANFLTYMYEIKGATLQFRSAANTATRAGKIITVKIPKRPAPPSLKVDGSKLLISGIKANVTQYFNPDRGIWEFVTTNTKDKTVSLYTLTKTNAIANTPIPAGAYEFRVYSGDKKVVSGVRLIEVPAQPTFPNQEFVKLEGLTLTITDTVKRSYEYSILSSFGTFNPATMKWTTISTNKPTVIKKAYPQDRIFVRLKSTTDKMKVVTPASTCVVLTVK